MEVKIYYIGHDGTYWSRLQTGFNSAYPEFNFVFYQIEPSGEPSSKKLFVELYENKPAIIYIDLSAHIEMGIRLAKLINRNNEMRLCAVVGLYDYFHGYEIIKRGVNAAIRLNHIKMTEMQDAVYGPISLLNVNKAQMPEYVYGRDIGAFEISIPMRVGYVEENLFHIETNTYLKVGDIVDIERHPLTKVMPSKKVYVQKFYKNNLYYNKRFAYDLEFMYIDNDYFSVTNKRWALYKDLLENPEKLDELEEFEELNHYEKEDILSDLDIRRKKYQPIKDDIDNWIESKKGIIQPKRLKILIIELLSPQLY